MMIKQEYNYNFDYDGMSLTSKDFQELKQRSSDMLLITKFPFVSLVSNQIVYASNLIEARKLLKTLYVERIH
jgi:hypothetical protein